MTLQPSLSKTPESMIHSFFLTASRGDPGGEKLEPGGGKSFGCFGSAGKQKDPKVVLVVER